MISYAQVTIDSQCQVWFINFIGNQQTIISIIETIAIYHNMRKSQEQSFSASSHTQLSQSLLQLLTLTQYLWLWSFNQKLRKTGAYCVASQRIHLQVMSTIIAYANLHPVGYIYHDLSNTRSLPKDKMKKGKVRIILTQA